MAVSLNGSRRGGRRQLICGVCQDVYRSPLLLPCHHTFCSHCLVGLVKARGGRPFPCPACRRTTTVPSGGASCFPSNFHIEEEDLELARKGSSTILCPVHDMTPLEFVCVQCDQTICIKCRLTKHMHHEAEDLSEAASRSNDRLETVKDRLGSTINFLIKQAEEADDNHKAAIEKGKLLEEQVKVQHDTLVTRLVKQRDSVLNEIQQSNAKVVGKLSAETQNVKEKVDSLLQLQQRVHHALDYASDAEKVHAEKEMREEGQGNVEQLKSVESSVPDTTARPGLHYDQSAISDDDIRRFFGSPVELSLPSRPVTEVIVPIYQCGQEGACREVHNVCHVNDQDIYISFGGTLPDYAGKGHITITVNGDRNAGSTTKSKEKDPKETFVKYAEKKSMYFRYNKSANCILFAKNEVLVNSTQMDSKTGLLSKITATSIKPLETTESFLFKFNSEHTVAFDATKDEQLFVIIEEKTTVQSQQAEYSVLLFHRDQSDPFTAYRPPNAGFHPTDVCFWQEDGRQKLLVADAQNDSVHVVNVEEGACLFERYLAAGNGHLVRPTALNVDDRNRVWIGCGNGWILRCQTFEEQNECHEDGYISDSDSSVQLSVVSDNDRQLQMVQHPGPAAFLPAGVSSPDTSPSITPVVSPSGVSIRSPSTVSYSAASGSTTHINTINTLLQNVSSPRHSIRSTSSPTSYSSPSTSPVVSPGTGVSIRSPSALTYIAANGFTTHMNTWLQNVLYPGFTYIRPTSSPASYSPVLSPPGVSIRSPSTHGNGLTSNVAINSDTWLQMSRTPDPATTPTRSLGSSPASYISPSISSLVSPEPSLIRSPSIHASDSSVVSGISIRSSDTLSQLSE